MKTESMKYYNGSGECTYELTDPNEIHKSLMDDLIAKKLHRCTYIHSIKDKTNYDGTRTITVYKDSNCKAVYVVQTNV